MSQGRMWDQKKMKILLRWVEVAQDFWQLIGAIRSLNISCVPFFFSAKEAQSSRQSIPRHNLQVFWTSSIRLHRIPRQVSNTHYSRGRTEVGEVKGRFRSRLYVKLAHECFLDSLLINQSPLLLFCFTSSSSVSAALVPLHASVSTVAEMFPISCTTTETGRKREGGWINAVTADMPIFFPTFFSFLFFFGLDCLSSLLGLIHISVFFKSSFFRLAVLLLIFPYFCTLHF